MLFEELEVVYGGANAKPTAGSEVRVIVDAAGDVIVDTPVAQNDVNFV